MFSGQKHNLQKVIYFDPDPNPSKLRLPVGDWFLFFFLSLKNRKPHWKDGLAPNMWLKTKVECKDFVSQIDTLSED